MSSNTLGSCVIQPLLLVQELQWLILIKAMKLLMELQKGRELVGMILMQDLSLLPQRLLAILTRLPAALDRLLQPSM
jgi:hypothetical protein